MNTSSILDANLLNNFIPSPIGGNNNLQNDQSLQEKNSQNQVSQTNKNKEKTKKTQEAPEIQKISAPSNTQFTSSSSSSSSSRNIADQTVSSNVANKQPTTGTSASKKKLVPTSKTKTPTGTSASKDKLVQGNSSENLVIANLPAIPKKTQNKSGADSINTNKSSTNVNTNANTNPPPAASSSTNASENARVIANAPKQISNVPKTSATINSNTNANVNANTNPAPATSSSSNENPGINKKNVTELIAIVDEEDENIESDVTLVGEANMDIDKAPVENEEEEEEEIDNDIISIFQTQEIQQKWLRNGINGFSMQEQKTLLMGFKPSWIFNNITGYTSNTPEIITPEEYSERPILGWYSNYNKELTEKSEEMFLSSTSLTAKFTNRDLFDPYVPLGSSCILFRVWITNKRGILSKKDPLLESNDFLPIRSGDMLVLDNSLNKYPSKYIILTTIVWSGAKGHKLTYNGHFVIFSHDKAEDDIPPLSDEETNLEQEPTGDYKIKFIFGVVNLQDFVMINPIMTSNKYHHLYYLYNSFLDINKID